jgi:putative heme-binding domain-containing protein
MREEALITLRLWRNPPPLDRVDGWARTFDTARIDDVLTPKLDPLLALNDPGLKTIAIEIMIAHQLRGRPEQIAAIVMDSNASGELRAQSLRLMAGAGGQQPAMNKALDAALGEDAPAPLHQAALELLLPGEPTRLAREAQQTLQRRSVAEKQHAIALLARAAHAEADAVLLRMADSLVDATVAPNVKLDVIEALNTRAAANPSVAAKLKRYRNKPAANSQEELLAGGDNARGRDIVANHLAANCTACHSVESSGGSEVGPNLRTVGSQRDPAYLLESLVVPSAQIATGFGIVNVTLKNKTEVTGTLARETTDAVTVRLFDGRQQTLPRTDIARQTPPVSIMPPMMGILQPRELRDVVSYLSSLKGGGSSGNRAASSNGGK